MKKGILFFMVWLLVLAVPLIATPVSGNTDYKVQATSLVNEEVPFNQQGLFDDNIAVLSVGAKERYLLQYNLNETLKIFTKTIESSTVAFEQLQKTMGGVSRIKSGRH